MEATSELYQKVKVGASKILSIIDSGWSQKLIVKHLLVYKSKLPCQAKTIYSNSYYLVFLNSLTGNLA